MRTTIDIPDELHRQIKVKSAQEGRSVKELVLEALEAKYRPKSDKRQRVKLPLIRSKRKDKINLTREQIDEAMFG
jgi:hypothetical protein